MLSPRLRVLRLSHPLVLGAALLLAAATLLVPASPASAHDELIASDPAASATLAALPAQLTLTFSGAIDPTPGATEVQVTDAAGTSLVAGSPTALDNVVTQPLAGTASGAVTVVWKVVSSDGAPISGVLAFTVGPPPAPEPTETATPTPTPTPDETPTPTPSVSSEDEDSTFADVWPWIIGSLLVAGVGGAVLYLVISRRRRDRDTEALQAGKVPPQGR